MSVRCLLALKPRPSPGGTLPVRESPSAPVTVTTLPSLQLATREPQMHTKGKRPRVQKAADVKNSNLC